MATFIGLIMNSKCQQTLINIGISSGMSNQLHPVLLYIESRLFSKIIKKFSNKVLIEWTLNIFSLYHFQLILGNHHFQFLIF